MRVTGSLGCASPASHRPGSTRASTASTRSSLSDDETGDDDSCDGESRDDDSLDHGPVAHGKWCDLYQRADILELHEARVSPGAARARDRALEVFRAAVIACDPMRRVAAIAPRTTIGIAVGKAALAMARGAVVNRGIVVTPFPGHVDGWRVIVSSHPHPDARSVEAARVVREFVDGAVRGDSVLALISGGASALIEDPLIPLDDFVATIRALMDSGAPIEAINAKRCELSAIKGGKLVAGCWGRVITLVASDIIGDPIELVGSGPTVHRGRIDAGDDSAEVVLPMRAFAEAIADAVGLTVVGPYSGEVDEVAAQLAGSPPCVAWGEPTLRVPDDHGEGGRAQQLALELARRFRGTSHSAFVAGTDGIDGPASHARPTPAGAFVDGSTWNAIIAAGIDPERALARRDAGTALAAVDALVVTGPTGVNHADIAILF